MTRQDTTLSPEPGPDFDSAELIPAVVQDHRSGEVLMLAFMNRTAFDQTVQTGEVHFWSRSREELWRKGATSGNTLAAREIHVDCDRDTILVIAEPAGPACHTGDATCFGQTAGEPDQAVGFRHLESLWETIADRANSRPDGSYTTELLAGGVDLTGRKVLEEAGEVAFAAKNHAAGTDDDARVASEAADLVYHLLVLMAEREINPRLLIEELDARAGGTDS